MHEVMFFDKQKYIYSESLFNTLYIEIKHNVRKCSWDKINVAKMHSFFNCELQLISFTFNFIRA